MTTPTPGSGEAPTPDPRAELRTDVFEDAAKALYESFCDSVGIKPFPWLDSAMATTRETWRSHARAGLSVAGDEIERLRAEVFQAERDLVLWLHAEAPSPKPPQTVEDQTEGA